MAVNWRGRLDLWLEAGLIDQGTVDDIVEYEGRATRTLRSNWPVLLTLTLGALLIGAGVLLFVSAHWDGLSAAQRLAVVLLLVAGFHLAGAILANRSGALSSTLHTLGTIALGAGIALTGQIFNLSENWPSGILLWAAGATAAYLLLRNWPQLTLLAVLAPMWIASEWFTRYPEQAKRPVLPFLLLVALTYLSALLPGRTSDERRALYGLGTIAALPLGILAAVFLLQDQRRLPSPDLMTYLEWVLAFLLPLGAAVVLRGRQAWMNAAAAVWVAVLSLTALQGWSLLVHAWCALGSAGLIAWGVYEARSERVNLGVVGFAITVLFFYFSTLMDKLGRSVSLIVLGILVLVGGWALERGRRKLVARIRGGAA